MKIFSKIKRTEKKKKNQQNEYFRAFREKNYYYYCCNTTVFRKPKLVLESHLSTIKRSHSVAQKRTRFNINLRFSRETRWWISISTLNPHIASAPPPKFLFYLSSPNRTFFHSFYLPYISHQLLICWWFRSHRLAPRYRQRKEFRQDVKSESGFPKIVGPRQK